MRILVAILSILYLVASTGVTLNMHYCMGELAGATLLQQMDEKCGKCGMEKEHGKDNGCCKDESKLVKAEEQNSTATIDVPTGFDIITDVPEFYTNNSLSNSYSSKYFNTNLPNGPPLVDISSCPIFIQVRHILI